MTREHKQIIIYGAFGLLLGAKIVEVILTRNDVGFFDYWLLLIGLAAAVIHYLPTQKEAEEKKRGDDRGSRRITDQDEQEETLVLRDHTHIKREPHPRRDPQAARPPSRR